MDGLALFQFFPGGLAFVCVYAYNFHAVGFGIVFQVFFLCSQGFPVNCLFPGADADVNGCSFQLVCLHGNNSLL